MGERSENPQKISQGWCQSWYEALFLHYPAQARALQKLLPPSLQIATHSGSAWLSVVAFKMQNTKPRWWPLKGAEFLECNVRTYVTHQHTGRQGVWFFSLYANSFLACVFGKGVYRLPYIWSKIALQKKQKEHFRIHKLGHVSHFEYAKPQGGQGFFAKPGTLEHFLTERYALFASKQNSVFICQVEHPPWELHKACVHLHQSQLLQDLPVSQTTPQYAYYSPGVDVLSGPLKKLSHKTLQLKPPE